jgi:hypothetical protein
MFERFTDRAQKVMSLANQEAQRLNHEHVGTEHILIGLMAEGSGVGATVLKELGVDLKKARTAVLGLVEEGREPVAAEKLPHTARAKKVVEIAIEEARLLGQTYVGTEHLLLGLLTEREGMGDQALVHLGLDPSQVRMYTLKMLGVTVPLEKTASDPARLEDHILFWKTLADNLARGVALDGALKDSLNKLEDRPLEVIIDCMLEEVEVDSTLSTAMAVRKSVFSRAILQMVLAGEAAEVLDVAAGRIAEGLENGSFGLPGNPQPRPAAPERFWRALGLLLSTGVPLVAALNALAAEESGAVYGKQLPALKQAVSAGRSLAEALREFPDVFTRELCSTVEAAEKQSTLDDAAFQIADTFSTGK